MHTQEKCGQRNAGRTCDAIHRKLGSGSMGTVYLARDLRESRLVALKVLRTDRVSPGAVEGLTSLYDKLCGDIARGVTPRRRRPRAYARVVKIKTSNFKLKTFRHQEIRRDFSAETRILGATG